MGLGQEEGAGSALLLASGDGGPSVAVSEVASVGSSGALSQPSEGWKSRFPTWPLLVGGSGAQLPPVVSG